MPGRELACLIRDVPLEPGAEVTVEANPEHVTPEWARMMRSAGVSRVSIGVQSFDPAVLQSLGREHPAEAVQPAVAAVAAAGIPRYSIDLIYGAAGETDESFRASLEAALSLDPPPQHVSAYALTVEPGTPLAADVRRHPDDDVQAARYEIADAVLSGHGLFWYEISNWAVPGEECRHNQNYWRGGNYLGVGCAAHSHSDGTRWWNLRTPERYLAAVAEGRSTVAVREVLSAAERTFERLELALRTPAGVPADAFGEGLEELVDAGLVDLVDRAGSPEPRKDAVLTLAGRLLANEVACRLLPGEGQNGGAPAGVSRRSATYVGSGDHQMQRNSPRSEPIPLSSQA